MEDFLDECENKMVNRPDEGIDEGSKDFSSDIEEKMLAKEARSDFKADVRRFLSNIVNFSLYVKKSPVDERKETARKFLNNMNGWIYRRKLNHKKIKSEYHHYLYEGILFPFSPKGNSASTLVVLLHPDCEDHPF